MSLNQPLGVSIPKHLSRSIPKALTFLGLFSLFTTLLAKASVIVGLVVAARIMPMI